MCIPWLIIVIISVVIISELAAGYRNTRLARSLASFSSLLAQQYVREVGVGKSDKRAALASAREAAEQIIYAAGSSIPNSYKLDEVDLCVIAFPTFSNFIDFAYYGKTRMGKPSGVFLTESQIKALESQLSDFLYLIHHNGGRL